MERKFAKDDKNHAIQIPVIEIPEIGSDEAIGNALVDACARFGFVFIKGKSLGFTPDILNSTFGLVSIQSM